MNIVALLITITMVAALLTMACAVIIVVRVGYLVRRIDDWLNTEAKMISTPKGHRLPDEITDEDLLSSTIDEVYQSAVDGYVSAPLPREDHVFEPKPLRVNDPDA